MLVDQIPVYDSPPSLKSHFVHRKLLKIGAWLTFFIPIYSAAFNEKKDVPQTWFRNRSTKTMNLTSPIMTLRSGKVTVCRIPWQAGFSVSTEIIWPFPSAVRKFRSTDKSGVHHECIRIYCDQIWRFFCEKRGHWRRFRKNALLTRSVYFLWLIPSREEASLFCSFLFQYALCKSSIETAYYF